MIPMASDMEAFVEAEMGLGLERFLEAEAAQISVESFVEAQLGVLAAKTLEESELPPIPDAPNERLLNLWRELIFRGVSSSEDALRITAEWNPAAHPRGPDGRFVERPWPMPGDIQSMDTAAIIRELAQDDPDFLQKAEGLQVDMEDDLVDVARQAIEDGAGQTDSPTADELIEEHGTDSLDAVSSVIEDAATSGTDLGAVAERLSEEKSDGYIIRAAKEAAESATTDVEGFDADGRLVYSFDSKELPEEAETQFLNEVDEDTAETVQNSVGKWELDFFAENMAPMWQAAMEDTGNRNLLTDEEDVADPDVPDEELKSIRQQREHTQEVLREIYGDTVPVYRAFQGDAGQDLESAAQNGEEIELDRRALESYTTELSYAKGYVRGQPGAVVKREVPVEDVWAASDAGFLAPEENELVVEHPESEVIQPDDILTHEDLDDAETNVRLIGEQIRKVEG